jgi:transposase
MLPVTLSDAQWQKILPFLLAHLVECFINKVKHYRRVFARFEKLSKNYLGFLSFVSALVWLR